MCSSDLMNTKPTGNPDVTGIDRAILQTLKPGGAFVVIDHASANGAGFAVAETLHRSDKDAVKAEILSAGFTFDSESKVLANTTDDHTKAVNDPSLHDKTDQFALPKEGNGFFLPKQIS